MNKMNIANKMWKNEPITPSGERMSPAKKMEIATNEKHALRKP